MNLANAGPLGVVLRIVLVVVIALAVVEVVATIFRRLEALDRAHARGSAARRATLYRLIISATRYVVGFIALIIVLDFLGVHTTSILAGAGILGLAVAFGAQNFVQDVVTGLSLMYEDTYQVGESVLFPALALSGTVEEVGIRITRIVGPSGELVTLPNRLVSEVTNYSRGSVSLSVPITMDVACDPAAVRAALSAAAQKLSTEAVAVKVTGITGVAPGAVTWTLSATVPNGQQGALGMAVREAVLATCHAQGLALAPAP
ncbi:MAG: mechanosensitive ion channel [Thermaerobacter sp.]|nr:mechanosensitive ion channel [Thermaerobacter sp.]